MPDPTAARDRASAERTLNAIRYTPAALVAGFICTCLIGPGIIVGVIISAFNGGFPTGHSAPAWAGPLILTTIGMCGIAVTLLTLPLLLIWDEYVTDKSKARALLASAVTREQRASG